MLLIDYTNVLIVFAHSFAVEKTFKFAANSGLKLQCNQLHSIIAIAQEGCILFAKLWPDSNGINYDLLNSVCDIQKCEMTSNFPTLAILSANMSIFFEVGLKPQSKFN